MMADPSSWGTLVTAIFAGFGTILVALNTRRGRAAELDEEDRDELERRRDWEPDVRRWHAAERARIAEAAPAAPDLRPLPPLPPSKLKRKPVKADDDS
jgi:hypothetical protein